MASVTKKCFNKIMSQLSIIFMVFMLFAAAYPLASAIADDNQTGRDVWGKPEGTNVQGNAGDKNSEGDRPEDAKGNPPKDFYGNRTGTDTK